MIAPKGKLVIIGGAVDLGSNVSSQERVMPQDHLKFFDLGIVRRMINESAKHEGSVVEVITTASPIPELVGAEYTKAFKQLNVPKINILDIQSREDASNKGYLDKIRKADIVIFTGGDQLKLSSIFGGTEFLQILKARYQKENFMIAGTSAGAAALSAHMIYRGQNNEALIKGEVQITAGLGFIDTIIIDTHFVQRGRVGRLMYAVASNPGMLGIGLGEDTALLITDGIIMEAIGPGLVILVDGKNMVETNIYDVELGSPISIENLRLHVMSIFDKYDLQQHRLSIKKIIKVEEGVFIKGPDNDFMQ